MAVQKKNNTPSAKTIKEMGEEFTNQATALWKKHIKEALAILEEAEEPIITLNFKVKLNFAETYPKLTTGIRFSQSYTDEKVAEFDDPNQLPLPNVTKEAKAAEKDKEKD